MKKSIILIVAAFATLCVSSCVKEELYDSAGPKVSKTFRCSFADVTKTNLTEEGKTVWAFGDTIWVSNGKDVAKVGVPIEADGETSFEFHLDLCDTSSVIYAVYPASAASGISEGKVVFSIPSLQDGTFSSANISAARATTNEFAFKNVTSIFKFTVPDETLVGVQSVAINTAGNTIAGKCSVDLSGEAPVVTPLGATTGIVVEVNGTGGEFFAAAAAGTYKAGMTITAVGQELACHTKTLDEEKVLPVNYIANLGSVGEKMRSLKGYGTEASPYRISTLAEMLAFTYYVNNGNDMEGEYVKVMNDIEGVTAPIGYYNSIESADYYFKGDFNGQGHTITLAMSGDALTGLFGNVGPGANIHDVVVDGTVTGNGTATAGVVAYADAESADSLCTTISNCINKATVNGVYNVGGILGCGEAVSSNGLVIENCSNNGAVNASYNVGGIAGKHVKSVIDNCVNNGPVASTTACGTIYQLYTNAYVYANFDGTSKTNVNGLLRGTGGVSGYNYNSTIKECTNNGTVDAVNKAGGLCGMLYWGSVRNSVNNGAITTSNTIAGGIASMIFAQGAVIECENNGTVTASAVVGGILGHANAQERSSSVYMYLTDCTNNGAVFATNYTSTSVYNYSFPKLSAAGGIVGSYESMNKDWLNVVGCENTADVYGLGQAVGGVLGWFGNARTGSAWGCIDKCSNSGNITSDLHRAGGIAGVIFERFTLGRYTIRNCHNSGTVTAPYVVGGLVGWESTAYPGLYSGQNYPIPFYNNYDTGKVRFTNNNLDKVYAGGICGYTQQTNFENCYTNGDVACTSELEEGISVESHTGKMFGFVGNYCVVRYCYCAYEEEARLYGKTIGTNTTIEYLAMAEDGQLDIPVIINGEEIEYLDIALNAWVDLKNGENSTYALWLEGPEFDFGE